MFDVAQLRANAYLELKDAHAARAAAIEVQATAATDEQRDYSVRLLRSIDDFLTNQAAIAAILANRAAADAARASAADETESARTARAMAADPANGRVSIDGHALFFATGRLRMVICSSPPAIEVDTREGSLTLLIDAPKMIRVFGTGTTEADLTCGWHDRRIRVGYYRPVRAGRATGNLRMLDYR